MASRGPFSKSWDELSFTDNYIFCKVLQQNKELSQKMLEILIGIEITNVDIVESEKTIDNFYGTRSVRLDVYAKNETQAFDIEMQTCNYENLLLRARYYQSSLDQEEMERSADFEKLKNSYIIFLCLDDPIGYGSYIYTKQSVFKEYPDKSYNDKSNIVFYNCSAYKDVEDKELRNVLEFIYNANSNSTFTDKLQKSVDDTKKSPEWRKEYMKLSEIINDSKKEGVKEGKEEAFIETAINMLKDGKLSAEEIAQYTKLPLEKINQLAKEVLVPTTK